MYALFCPIGCISAKMLTVSFFTNTKPKYLAKNITAIYGKYEDTLYYVLYFFMMHITMK